MIRVNVTIEKDTAGPALAALKEAIRPENLAPLFGRSVTNAVRENFDILEGARPNKLGGKRTHYYSGARSSTSFVVEGDVATVGVRQVGIRLRYFGGDVEAGKNTSIATGQPTKYLTIPVTPESYGMRAADFPDLILVWGPRGPYGLARVTKGTIAKGRNSSTEQWEILFLLVPKVTIEGDDTILPTAEKMDESVRSDFGKYINLLWRRAGANGGSLTA